MVDIFWVTVFGLGLILGGMVLIKNVLQVSDWILVAYLIVSSTAFTINFGLSLWQIRRLARIAEEVRASVQIRQLDTNELGSVNARSALKSVPSVTENTTRALEPISKEQST